MDLSPGGSCAVDLGRPQRKSGQGERCASWEQEVLHVKVNFGSGLGEVGWPH